MSDIVVCSFGRKESRRCPNKLLRPLGETTLTDVMLEKLARCQAETRFAGREEDFRIKCEAHGVPFIRRDARSVELDEPIVEILSFLREVDAKHILLVNACLPFLRVETIEAFLEDCRAHGNKSAFSVLRRKNNFMRLDRRAVNFDAEAATINTKMVEPLYEFVHGLYFFNREEFLATGRYWDWKSVRLIEMPEGLELLDVDTEQDFRLAEVLWKAGAKHWGVGEPAAAANA